MSLSAAHMDEIYLEVFFLITGKRAVVGYQDGAVKIWDLKLGSVLHYLTGRVGGNIKLFIINI